MTIGSRKRRPTLIVTRGLPASGKTTAAVAWVRADRDWRTRINRDDLRDMGHGGRLGTPAQEAIVTGLQQAGAREALSHGTSVIVDDTTLREDHLEAWARLAEQADADFEIWDFRDVKLEVCLARNAQRDDDDRVPEERIREMYREFILGSRAAATVPTSTRTTRKG